MDTDLDPFNVSMEDDGTKIMMRGVAASYSFPFTRCVQKSPLIVLSSVITLLITSLFFITYKPSSTVDFVQTHATHFRHAKFIDLTLAPKYNVTYASTASYSPTGSIAGTTHWSEEGSSEGSSSGSAGTTVVAPSHYSEHGATLQDAAVSLASLAPLYVVPAGAAGGVTVTEAREFGRSRKVAPMSVIACDVEPNGTVTKEALAYFYGELEAAVVATAGERMSPDEEVRVVGGRGGGGDFVDFC